MSPVHVVGKEIQALSWKGVIPAVGTHICRSYRKRNGEVGLLKLCLSLIEDVRFCNRLTASLQSPIGNRMGKPGSLAFAVIMTIASVVWARALPAEQVASDQEKIGSEMIGPAVDCAISMTAKAEPLAMAALTITAGCLPEEQIVPPPQWADVLAIKPTLAGVARMTVPALTTKSNFCRNI